LVGITIGDGAIFATNAWVIKDLPANTIVGGNPASVLKAKSPDLAHLLWPATVVLIKLVFSFY
tara:strand:+ start:8807 stop:8995 length:189 start_codon:yes stop_codon:yes gene_type:complete